ncbi:MAG: hypothetical protein H7A37_06850 [Chlamydiales bacterium]|nr:hypothetical protein [Chlamydiia bacterium]MCP5508000.1 hypothetical protein [Chlamydiales bacterium]
MSWKDAFFRSFKRCHRLIGASILYPLAIFLGLQFFVLPALIVYINLYCFLPIMLLEDKPVIKSWMLSNELMASSASNVLGPLKLWVVYMIISGLSLATTFTLMKLDISSIPVAITLIIFSFIVDVSGKIFGIIAPTVYYEHVKANSQ